MMEHFDRSIRSNHRILILGLQKERHTIENTLFPFNASHRSQAYKMPWSIMALTTLTNPAMLAPTM